MPYSEKQLISATTKAECRNVNVKIERKTTDALVFS